MIFEEVLKEVGDSIGNLVVNGVFMAEPVSNFIGGIACFTTMYFTVYRKLSTNIVKK